MAVVSRQLSQNSTPSAIDGRDDAADQLHEAGADQVPDPLGVGHDARDEHAGLGRVEVADRQPRDVLLHRRAHVGDRPLRRDAQHLRQRERRWPPAPASRRPRPARAATAGRARDLPITSSMRNFEVAGRTSPARRLTTIRTMPSARRPRRAQTSSRASRHTTPKVGFFFLGLVSQCVPLARCRTVPSTRTHANQVDPLDRRLAVHPLGLDRLHDVHPAHHAAEDRVFAVERGRRARADEEGGRRAGRIGPARHRDDARHVERVVEFRLQRGHVALLLLR